MGGGVEPIKNCPYFPKLTKRTVSPWYAHPLFLEKNSTKGGGGELEISRWYTKGKDQGSTNICIMARSLKGLGWSHKKRELFGEND